PRPGGPVRRLHRGATARLARGAPPAGAAGPHAGSGHAPVGPGNRRCCRLLRRPAQSGAGPGRPTCGRPPMKLRRRLSAPALAALACAFAMQAAAQLRAAEAPPPFTPPAPGSIPDTPFGEVVRQGEQLFINTPAHAAKFVG